jgi:hypothetical protein
MKLFKWYVINVWAIKPRHIFWNLNISIMTMLSPSKISFSLRRSRVLKTHFSIWITHAFCVCNMGKHVSNILWGSHKNEFQKWKIMTILYVYFVQNGITTPNQKKWVKVGWKKSKHNFLSFKNFFMLYYICSSSLNATFQRTCLTF